VSLGQALNLKSPDQYKSTCTRGFNKLYLYVLIEPSSDAVSTEVLEEALVGSDPEGPLCELLFFFLSAIFQALDEEQEDLAKEQAEGQTQTRTRSSPSKTTGGSWEPNQYTCALWTWRRLWTGSMGVLCWGC